jgi:hypothetical protein
VFLVRQITRSPDHPIPDAKPTKVIIGFGNLKRVLGARFCVFSAGRSERSVLKDQYAPLLGESPMALDAHTVPDLWRSQECGKQLSFPSWKYLEFQSIAVGRVFFVPNFVTAEYAKRRTVTSV